MNLCDWKITFDPMELLSGKMDYDALMAEAIEQGEDIIQIENKKNRRVLDLGWYGTAFGIYLVDGDWDKPLKNERFESLKEAVGRFRQLAENV